MNKNCCFDGRSPKFFISFGKKQMLHINYDKFHQIEATCIKFSRFETNKLKLSFQAYNVASLFYKYYFSWCSEDLSYVCQVLKIRLASSLHKFQCHLLLLSLLWIFYAKSIFIKTISTMTGEQQRLNMRLLHEM